MSKLSKIEEIYHEALEKSLSERDDFLKQTCGDDVELRREVESLLEFDAEAEDFIESPPEDLAAALFEKGTNQNIVGKKLNHYRVLSPLGAGGMGEVYLAEDMKLGRKIALKLLPQQFSTDAERQKRFEQEARAVSALNHPNIITIYEIETAENINFIATEFIDGQTLRERITEKPFSAEETVEIAIQITSALESAHSVGIIHRDIKPANIMIRKDGIVKVLDFGLAKLTLETSETREQTAPNRVMGTINYMSPEQALGEKVDARTDIFSFGVVLYEMLSGIHPFKGTSDAAIYNATINKNPLPLSEIISGVDLELERIVSKAMEKNPANRYQTAGDLRPDLERLKENSASFAQSFNSFEVKPALPKAKTFYSFATPFNFLILPVILGCLLLFFFTRSASENTPINSIAVLPFENKSADADTEYLSDGLAESLIYRLSQFPHLKVSPTSSVFRYKGKETDLPTISKALGVDAIVTGRILQRGEMLTISVELVDVRNNKILWGNQFTRNMSELLATQREISTEITNHLKPEISGENEQKTAKKYTENNEAHQLYLKGRFLYGKRKKEDILKGIEYFRQAVNIDPNFAPAYVGIADCYNILPTYAYLSSKEAVPQAKFAAQKALEIDPSLAEAHSALAFALTLSDWNWAEAETEYKLALELNPNIAEIHFRYGLDFLIPMGRTAEAIKEIEKAVELEPLSLANIAGLSGAYMFARQNERAVEKAQKALDLEPDFVGGRIWLGYIYATTGRYEKSLAISEESLQIAPHNQAFLRLVGYNYAKLGRREEAEKVIEKFREIAKKQYVAAYYAATIYAALGKRDEAFAELEKSFSERDYLLLRLKVDPFMDSLRDDPRFAQLLKRIGLTL